MYQKRILANGLTVITAPLRETQTVTALLLVRAGARYEHKKNNGISHFLEHMMFKGTTKRPSTLVLSRELDSVGADYNAFTAKDHTGYYIKVNAEKLELALDLLSDMIFNSTFAAGEIKREKGVIIEEINMYNDNPLMSIEDRVEELIFFGQKLASWPGGTKKSVQGLNRADMLAYLNKFYQASNMVLTLAGKLSTRDLKMVDKYFGLAPAKKRQIKILPFVSRQKAARNKTVIKETDQLQIALGWPAFGYQQEASHAAYLLATILGGNMSSRLFTEVREKRGLAYYVRAVNNVYEDTGCIVIQAGLDKKRWQEAVTVILEEIKKIKREGVTSEELKRAKEFLKGKLAIDLEDSSHLAEWYGRQELLVGKILQPEERIKKIFKVKKIEIQGVAKKIFSQNKLNLAIIGDLDEQVVKAERF
jgi:predicted Zn-dependent peptidase